MTLHHTIQAIDNRLVQTIAPNAPVFGEQSALKKAEAEREIARTTLNQTTQAIKAMRRNQYLNEAAIDAELKKLGGLRD